MDTALADRLAARVLTQEHLLYPSAIAQWLARQTAPQTLK